MTTLLPAALALLLQSTVLLLLGLVSMHLARRHGYALNRNCSGESVAAFADPQGTIMAFDSTLGTRNASDIGQSLRAVTAVPAPGSSCVFMDGHVKWFRRGTYPSFSLRGGQPTASDTATVGMTALRQHTAEWQRQSENFRSRGITSTRSDALSQARLLAGLTPVQGPGVVVTLNDSKKKMPAQLPPGMAPPNLIYNSDINQVVNELKAAGAEAIAINGQRLVATSYIRPAGPTILINSTPTVPPYVTDVTQSRRERQVWGARTPTALWAEEAHAWVKRTRE